MVILVYVALLACCAMCLYRIGRGPSVMEDGQPSLCREGVPRGHGADRAPDVRSILRCVDRRDDAVGPVVGRFRCAARSEGREADDSEHAECASTGWERAEKRRSAHGIPWRGELEGAEASYVAGSCSPAPEDVGRRSRAGYSTNPIRWPGPDEACFVHP